MTASNPWLNPSVYVIEFAGGTSAICTAARTDGCGPDGLYLDLRSVMHELSFILTPMRETSCVHFASCAKDWIHLVQATGLTDEKH